MQGLIAHSGEPRNRIRRAVLEGEHPAAPRRDHQGAVLSMDGAAAQDIHPVAVLVQDLQLDNPVQRADAHTAVTVLRIALRPAAARQCGFVDEATLHQHLAGDVGEVFDGDRRRRSRRFRRLGLARRKYLGKQRIKR
ncbi:hypothetical protein D3C84_736890 [compost metagenome]